MGSPGTLQKQVASYPSIRQLGRTDIGIVRMRSQRLALSPDQHQALARHCGISGLRQIWCSGGVSRWRVAGRHFGLVVDDKTAARKALEAAGVTLLPGRFLDFRDPWANRVEIVSYENIQFTKAPNVLRGMGLTHLTKNENAKKELAEKGMVAQGV